MHFLALGPGYLLRKFRDDTDGEFFFTSYPGKSAGLTRELAFRRGWNGGSVQHVAFAAFAEAVGDEAGDGGDGLCRVRAAG
jgi:hypothetical protein